MAKVANFIYCLDSVASGQDTNAMGVLTAITPEYVPGEFSFSILLTVVDIKDGDHQVSLQFMSPENQELANVEGTVPFQKSNEVDLPSQYEGVNISVNIKNVVFKESGLYKTKVCFDGQDCGSFDIFVKGKNEA